jgi:hypothetical protein
MFYEIPGIKPMDSTSIRAALLIFSYCILLSPREDIFVPPTFDSHITFRKLLPMIIKYFAQDDE